MNNRLTARRPKRGRRRGRGSRPIHVVDKEKDKKSDDSSSNSSNKPIDVVDKEKDKKSDDNSNKPITEPDDSSSNNSSNEPIVVDKEQPKKSITKPTVDDDKQQEEEEEMSDGGMKLETMIAPSSDDEHEHNPMDIWFVQNLIHLDKEQRDRYNNAEKC